MSTDRVADAGLCDKLGVLLVGRGMIRALVIGRTVDDTCVWGGKESSRIAFGRVESD